MCITIGILGLEQAFISMDNGGRLHFQLPTEIVLHESCDFTYNEIGKNQLCVYIHEHYIREPRWCYYYKKCLFHSLIVFMVNIFTGQHIQSVNYHVSNKQSMEVHG